MNDTQNGKADSDSEAEPDDSSKIVEDDGGRGDASRADAEDAEDAEDAVEERRKQTVPPGGPVAWHDRDIFTLVIVGLAILASFGWLGLSAFYVDRQVGWENVLWLLPHELATGIAGVLTPLLLLWLVINTVQRVRHAKAAAPQAVTPATEIDAKLAAMAETLEKQTEVLDESSEAALRHARELGDALRRECEQLRGVANSVAGDLESALGDSISKAGQIGDSLRESATVMTDELNRSLDASLDGSVAKAGRIGATLRETAASVRTDIDRSLDATLSGAAAKAEQIGNTLRGTAASVVSALDDTLGAAYDDSIAKAEHVSTTIRESANSVAAEINDALASALDESIAKAERVKTTLQESAASVNTELADSLVAALDGSVAKAEHVSTTLRETTAGLSAELTRSLDASLGGSIAKAEKLVADLRETASAVSTELNESIGASVAQMENISGSLRTEIGNWAELTEAATGKLEEASSTTETRCKVVAGAIESGVAALLSASDKTAMHTASIGADLRRLTDDMATAAETAGTKAASISSAVADQSEALEIQLGSITRLTESAGNDASKLGEALAIRSKALDEIALHVTARVGEIRQTLNNDADFLGSLAANVDRLLQVPEATKQHTAEIDRVLKQNSDALREVGENAASQANSALEVIQRVTEQLNSASTAMGSRADEVGESLITKSSDFRATVDGIISAIQNMDGGLRHTVDELNKAYDRAASQMQTMESALTRHSDALAGADGAAGKDQFAFVAETEKLRELVNELSAQLGSATQEIRSRIDDLSNHADKGGDEAPRKADDSRSPVDDAKLARDQQSRKSGKGGTGSGAASSAADDAPADDSGPLSAPALARILDDHRLWIESDGVEGEAAVLGGADLRGAELHGADLRKADLNGADLRGATLNSVNFEGAQLFRTNLEGANLASADLRKADLFRANLQQAILTNANLQEAVLFHAVLQDANLVGADLSNAIKLTQDQLDRAFGDGTTKLSDDMTIDTAPRVQAKRKRA